MFQTVVCDRSAKLKPYCCEFAYYFAAYNINKDRVKPSFSSHYISFLFIRHVNYYSNVQYIRQNLLKKVYSFFVLNSKF